MTDKILFNLIPTQPLRSKRHGGGRYGEAVVKYIISHHLGATYVYDSRKWLNPEIKDLILFSHSNIYDINEYSIEELLRNEGIDIYYTPIVSNDTIGKWDCKIVGTIHGLRSAEIPADFMYCKYKGLKNIVIYLIYKLIGKWYRGRERAKIKKYLGKEKFFPVTVSEFSAHSILSCLKGMYQFNLPVFYSPSTETNTSIESRVYKGKFFLIVSALVPFKNGLRALMALDGLFSKGCLSDFKVKVTGVSNVNSYRYKFRNPERFELLGFVEDVELEQVYHDAYCLIYPSLNEGFGYPPIEAMRYGVPVLASYMASIPEICKDAVLYFDPFSISDLTEKIMLIQNDDVYADLQRRSLNRYYEVHKKQEADLEELVHYIYNV